MKESQTHADQPVLRDLESLRAEFQKFQITATTNEGKGKSCQLDPWWGYGKGQSAAATNTKNDLNDDKTLEMLVWGFEDDSRRSEIVESIEKILESIPLEAVDVFTFEKTTNFGVIRFRDLADKRWFKRWLSKNVMKHGEKDLSASDNLEKEDNVKERSCGKVKAALCKAGVETNEVVVKYKRGIVQMSKETVAEWKDGQLCLQGRAKELEKEINMLLDAAKLRKAV